MTECRVYIVKQALPDELLAAVDEKNPTFTGPKSKDLHNLDLIHGMGAGTPVRIMTRSKYSLELAPGNEIGFLYRGYKLRIVHDPASYKEAGGI